MSVLNIGYFSNETNTDVRMYIEEFILVDVVGLLYMDEVIFIGNYTGIYAIAHNGREDVRRLE